MNSHGTEKNTITHDGGLFECNQQSSYQATLVLREVFLRADFTLDHVASLLSDRANAALSRTMAHAAREELAKLENPTDSKATAGAATKILHPDLACARLARLFLLGQALHESLLSELFDHVPNGFETLKAAGILTPLTQNQQRLYHASFSITAHTIEQNPKPALHWWIASDHGHLAAPQRAHLPSNWVPGIGGATTSLLSFMERNPVESVLDLGTGCGIIAMHATLFAKYVTATDISPRALDFARFNAWLNQIPLASTPDEPGLYLALGSLFEPVSSRRFDLIVSNPPFVISPPTEGEKYVYRDCGMQGDHLVETLLEQAGQYLNPGGSLQCLINWEQYETAHPTQRVLEWFTKVKQAGKNQFNIEGDLTNCPLEGALFWRQSQDPCEYAELWLSDEGLCSSDPSFERVYLDYLQDFDSRKVTAINLGYFFLRRALPQKTQEKARLAKGRTEDGFIWLDARQGPQPQASQGREILDTNSGRVVFQRDDHIHLLVKQSELAQVRHYALGSQLPYYQGLSAERNGKPWAVQSLSALSLGALSVADQPMNVEEICDILAKLLEVSPADALEQVLEELSALAQLGIVIPKAAKKQE